MLRRESLFTQGKEPDTRLTTFFQFCSEYGNIVFYVVVAESQVTCEKITRKWKETFKKLQKNRSQKK